MIVKQTLNFGANLVGGFILGVLAVGAMRMCRHMCIERLEPRYPSPPKAATTSPTSESSAAAAAI
jgi:hypothetical protein